jgi:uncharacterized protein YbjT (DUF2867 family)
MVARDLAARGVPQRLLVRDPARAPELPGSEVAVCTYSDDEAAHAALDGVGTLLMVSAAESATRLEEHRGFVDAAAAAGVRHVVYTSFLGAGPDCVFTLGRDHWATEEHLRASGMATTFLRDNFYADFLPMMVGDDDVIRGPAGDGLLSAVSRADVARVAVATLLDPGPHAGAAYALTGPEAMTLAHAAEVISEETGRVVTFHDETVEEAYESRRRWPAPQWQYDAWVSTYTAIRAGECAAVSDDVRRVTGRSPETLRTLLGGA